MIRDLRPQEFRSRLREQGRRTRSSSRCGPASGSWPPSIARRRDATTAIVDQAGDARRRPARPSRARFAAAARADSLIVDGYLTKQVAHDRTGVFTGS